MSTRYFEAEFGSIKVRFYALTVGQIQDLEDEMKEMGRVNKGENPFAPARFARLAKIYTASAQRGDPAITQELVEKVVDLDNILDINRAVLGQMGKPIAAVKAEEGELDPTNPTSPQIGGTSTPA